MNNAFWVVLVLLALPAIAFVSATSARDAIARWHERLAELEKAAHDAQRRLVDLRKDR